MIDGIIEHTIQYDRNTAYSLRNQFLDKLYKTVFDPSIVLFENNCPYMSKYLVILIKADSI